MQRCWGVTALIYFLAALSGAGWRSVVFESIGAGVFAALALLALRRSSTLLALGWVLHVGQDLSLHSMFSGGWMPHWYRWACAGFDLVIAGYILGRFAGRAA